MKKKIGIILFFAFFNMVLSQNNNPNEKLEKIQKTQEDIIKEIDHLKKEIEFEKEKFDNAREDFERLNETYMKLDSNLEKRYKTYIQHVERSHNIFLWIVGVIGTFGSALLIFFGIKTKKDLEEKIEVYEKKMTQDYKSKIDEIVRQKFREVKYETKEIVNTLEKKVEEEQNYKDKDILFIVEKDREIKEVQEEVETLENKLENGNIKITDKLQFSNLDYDLIIFYIKNVKETDGLENFLDSLENLEVSIPIIIYSYNSGKERIESQKLENYKWYIFSNMPVTLISNVYTILNVFGNKKRKRR